MIKDFATKIIDFGFLYKNIKEKTKEFVGLYIIDKKIADLISIFDKKEIKKKTLQDFFDEEYDVEWGYDFSEQIHSAIEDEGISYLFIKHLVGQLILDKEEAELFIDEYENEAHDDFIFPLVDDISNIIVNKYADKTIDYIYKKVQKYHDVTEIVEAEKVDLKLYQPIIDLYQDKDINKFVKHIVANEANEDYKAFLFGKLSLFLETNLDDIEFSSIKLPQQLLTYEYIYSFIDFDEVEKNSKKHIIELKYPKAIEDKNHIPFSCLFYKRDNIFNLMFTSAHNNIKIKSETLDWEAVYNRDFSIKMLIGKTGCGKTYNAIKRCVENNKSFIIAVPARQLACDIKLDYKDEVSNIYTGEISISGTSSSTNNTVCVYENLNDDLIKEHDVLIVDEAHYVGDEQRGGFLLDKILKAIKLNKEVVFLTATDTISKRTKELLHIEIEKLKEFKKVKRENIEIDEVSELAQKGKNIIVFVKYTPNEYVLEEYCESFNVDMDKAKLMTADTPTSERLQTQIDFKNGNLQMIVSTNVLAQGVNLPADIVVIEYNEYDDWEIVQQKVGRAGRPQFSNTAYVVKHTVPVKMVKERKKRKVEEITLFYKRMFIYDMQIPLFQIPRGFLRYADYKYSKSFLKELKDRGISSKIEDEVLGILEKEEEKVRKMLL